MSKHPITPPPDEMVREWCAWRDVIETADQFWRRIATQAAQWGADQRSAVNEAELQKARDEELEACCEVMRVNGSYVSDGVLRAIRRPQPPSDKEQALNALSLIMSRQKGMFDGKPFETIRKVLEAL